MAGQHDARTGQEGESAPVSRKRRGLIAGAAALMVAALAKQGAEPVAAVNGNPVILGGDAGGSGAAQSATATTWVATNPAPANGPAFRASNAFPGTPDATQDGIQGYTIGSNNAGVFGRNNDLNGVGTWGEAPSGTGAFGDSTSGSGVAGNSSSGAGVYGQSASGYGGQFVSTNNIGIYGLSSASYGIIGITTAGGPFSGITGGANTSGAAAFAGGTSNPAAYAAYFTGRTVVNGDFTVVGGQKNAAVQAADGSYRLLHCVEAPEPWFEDFGTASFTNGVASVNLDPDFASVVRTDAYHVFITEIDGFNGLYVTNQTASGFEVRSQNGGNGQFAWRLVAVRKDLKVSRLAKFTLPNIKIPSVDDLKAAGKPTIPTPRPAKGPSGAPPQPQPQPQPRGASSPASQPASQPASPPAPPPAPPPAAPAATGGTQPGPLPPSR